MFFFFKKEKVIWKIVLRIIKKKMFYQTENVCVNATIQNVYRYVQTYVISMDWLSRSV